MSPSDHRRRRTPPPFLAAVKASRRLHGQWVQAPSTPAQFRAYLKRYASREAAATHAGLLAVRKGDGALAFLGPDWLIQRGPYATQYVQSGS